MIKSMKVTDVTPALLEYPCLMESTEDGLVVLFNGHRSGVVVNTPKGQEDEIGYYYEGWSMSVFKLFHGLITLRGVSK